MNINRLVEEIDRLKAKIESDKNTLLGLEMALNLIKEPPLPNSTKKDVDPISEVQRIFNFLKEEKKPVHVNEIVKFLGNPNKGKKNSVAGTLNSYAKKKRSFIRVAPNTFEALKE